MDSEVRREGSCKCHKNTKWEAISTIIDLEQEVYYTLGLIMGCGVVERHLDMGRPTKSKQ